MKKVIKFMNLRVLFVIISVVLILGGAVGTILRGGFNLGIDFQAGLTMRVQVTENAFTITYTGEGNASFNINRTDVAVNITGTEASDQEYIFRFEDYTNLRSLRDALQSIPGISTELAADENRRADRLININSPVSLTRAGYTAHVLPQADSEIFAPISSMREALSSLGGAQITIVGPGINQEYTIRTQDSGEIENFSDEMSTRIQSLLAGYFSKGVILVNQTDYVGPRFSKDLGKQTFYLTGIALILILGYAWFRFKLGYAVSAIIALLHDALFMIGVIGTFQIEVSTATIAAVLTIVGYSINDTIVVYDRVRENVTLMRDTDFETIINTSISQSMSRSLMTSFTTILAVSAIYIFAAGTVKVFALNMIIGIVIGTYSSMFIASPILLGWTNSKNRRKHSKEEMKFGKHAEKLLPAGKPGDNGSGGEPDAAGAKEVSVSVERKLQGPQLIERKPPKLKKKPKSKKH
ncbi:MAG: protein translocase subunit SecF [Spirochaetales bacterium]|nr:MAG: protein translocase subunit SecF [Spirochaetales bacterium]